LASLDDRRAVFLDGERVGDVTKHPAFAEPIRRVAHTWDLARAPEAQSATTYVDPATGRRHSTMWLVPRSAEDLGARRRAHRLWALASRPSAPPAGPPVPPAPLPAPPAPPRPRPPPRPRAPPRPHAPRRPSLALPARPPARARTRRSRPHPTRDAGPRAGGY